MATSTIKRSYENLIKESNAHGLLVRHFDMNANLTLTINCSNSYPNFFIFGQASQPFAYVLIGQNVFGSGSGILHRLDSTSESNITLETGTLGKLTLKMPRAYFNFIIITSNIDTTYTIST